MLCAMDWIVSLTPEVAENPLEAIARPPEGASIVEVRADLFPGIDLRAAIRACPLPVLVTLRSSAEGGRGSTDPVERRAVLEAAREAGAALIDLEHERDGRLIRELGLAPEQVVLSWHSVDGTPEDLGEIVEGMLESKARWVKVVPTATSVADLMSVLCPARAVQRSRAAAAAVADLCDGRCPARPAAISRRFSALRFPLLRGAKARRRRRAS